LQQRRRPGAGKPVVTGRSPSPNLATSFGDIVAAAARGQFTDNRGVFHDPAGRSLLARRRTAKASWAQSGQAHSGPPLQEHGRAQLA